MFQKNDFTILKQEKITVKFLFNYSSTDTAAAI